MILREHIPVTESEPNRPSLSKNVNPFKWVSPQSLEILCSLLLTRLQAETVLRQFVDSQEVETLRIGALYRNLAQLAGRDIESGILLYQELQPKIQTLLDSALLVSRSISKLSAQWAETKKDATAQSGIDMRVPTVLLWELASRKGSWFRHLEQVVASDIHSLAIRSLGLNTITQPKITTPADPDGAPP